MNLPVQPPQQPNPAAMMKALEAMRGDPKLKPYLDRLNYIDKELERTHQTVRSLIESKSSFMGEELALLKNLRGSFIVELDSYLEASRGPRN